MPHTRSAPRLAYTLSNPPPGLSGEHLPVIFVNGLGGAQAAWLMATKHFARTRQALCFDHRGIGGSDWVPGEMQILDYAHDLLRLLDELGMEQVDAVGLSFGGRVLQELAAGWPGRVRRLVLGGTSAGGSGHTPGDTGAIRAMLNAEALTEEEWNTVVIPGMFGRRFREAEPDRLRNLARWWVRHPPPARALQQQSGAYFSFDMTGRLDRITCPALILHGTDDRLSPPANAMYLLQNLPAAHLVWMEGVGHSPNMEVPERFHAEIEAFLDMP